MIEKDLGLVIKRHNFRETSLIVNFYTSRFGKITGILKGFYAGKREFASPLSAASLNELVFYPKKSDIWLIAHADLVSDSPFLRNDFAKAKAAAVILSLIDKGMELWDKNSYIFNLVKNCLDCLKENEELKILYIFLIKFLTFSGFKPELNHCISCARTLDSEILFSISRGGFVCGSCRVKTKDVQKISREASQSLLYIQKEDFPLILRLKPTAACEEEILYILGQFLAYHLGFDAGLKSLSPAR